MSGCRECGERHETGLDGLVCDWTLGGEPRVREWLRRFGVKPSIIERTVAEVREVASR